MDQAALEPDDLNDRTDYRSEDVVTTVIVVTVLILAVIAIFITSLKALSEVIIILVKADVIAVVPERGILITVRILRAELPSVLAIRASGIIPLFVTTIDRILDHLRAVLTGVVVTAATRVSVIVDKVVVIACLL